LGWPYWGGYWGSGWAYGWNPWWYDPYWYAPGPSYIYQSYPDTGYVNRPPYDPDASYDDDYDSSASYSITPRLNTGALRFNLEDGVDPGDNGSDQNRQPAHPEAVPNGTAPAAPGQTQSVSYQSQI
jgi:hypothetical protein